jgi:branched-chain amino acid transport system ATP-binding protein
LSILELDNVNKSFGGLAALRGISITVGEDEICSVIGPNGAGKTTLFNVISGRFPPDNGRVIFNGTTINGKAPYRIVSLGMGRTFQITNIYPRLTAYENLQAAVIKRLGESFRLFKPVRFIPEIKKEATKILDELELGAKADEIASQLPYGDQRLLEVGIALANEPSLLLLDEPTAGMSPEETRSTVALIGRLTSERKMALLLIEHDMDVVFSISHRIFVLHQGLLIAEGTPKEVSSNEQVISAYLGE